MYFDPKSTAFLAARNVSVALQWEVEADRGVSKTAIIVASGAGLGIAIVIGLLLYVAFLRDTDSGDAEDDLESKSSGAVLTADMDPNAPALHFSSAEYVASRSDSSVKIRLMRVGKLDKSTIVAFKTNDLTAKAGKDYTPQSGTVVFEEGENSKQLEVQLLPSSLYQQSRSFEVALLHEGLQGARFSSQLSKTEVAIVDVDHQWPSMEFSDQIKSGDYASIDRGKLLMSYCSYTFTSNDNVRNATIKYMIIDQLGNLQQGWNYLLTVYLVDRVLNKKVADGRLVFEDREVGVAGIVLGMLIPQILMLVANAYKAMLDVPNMAKSALQRKLMSRYQSYDHQTSVNDVKHGAFMMNLFNDTSGVVSNGYVNFLAILQLFGRSVVLITFMILMPYLIPKIHGKGKGIGLLGTVTTLAFPIVLLIAYSITHSHVMGLVSAGFKKYISSVHLATQVVENHRLIKEYNQVHHYRNIFHRAVDEAAHAGARVAMGIGMQASAATWITIIVVAVFYWDSALRVLDGKLDVGMMVANIATLNQIGGAYKKIFSNAVGMQKSLGPLMRVTKYINMSTDHATLLKFRKTVEESTMDYQREQLAQGRDRVMEDDFPIVIPGCRISRANGEHFLINTKIQIQQGQVVVFMGEGAEALLRMMDIERLGEEIEALGTPFVPAHLRALFIKREPMFLDGTLLSNLVLGNEEATLEEVTLICTELGVSEDVRALLESKEEKNSYQWKDFLSAETQQILTIARAFVARPHLLGFESPGTMLDSKLSRKVMSMARKFVDSRAGGMCPRTVIMTAYQADDLDLADSIYYVSPEKGLRQVTIGELKGLGYE